MSNDLEHLYANLMCKFECVQKLLIYRCLSKRYVIQLRFKSNLCCVDCNKNGYNFVLNDISSVSVHI